MNYEEFLATYCTEQKGLEFLSGKKGATEREKFIVRMMGYDRLEHLQEMLRGDRKEKRVAVSAVEASLGTREDVEQRLDHEKQDLAKAREKHDEASQTLQKREGEFTILRTRMLKLDESRAVFMRERESHQALLVRLEERQRRLRSLADATILSEDELARALRPLAAGASLDESLTLLKVRLIEDRERLSELDEAKRSLEAGWREGIVQAQAEKDAVERQHAMFQNRVQKVGQLEPGSECPTCGQELGESFENAKKHFFKEQKAHC
jgi:exonuclease SbcC